MLLAVRSVKRRVKKIEKISLGPFDVNLCFLNAANASNNESYERTFRVIEKVHFLINFN